MLAEGQALVSPPLWWPVTESEGMAQSCRLGLGFHSFEVSHLDRTSSHQESHICFWSKFESITSNFEVKVRANSMSVAIDFGCHHSITSIFLFFLFCSCQLFYFSLLSEMSIDASSSSISAFLCNNSYEIVYLIV